MVLALIGLKLALERCEINVNANCAVDIGFRNFLPENILDMKHKMLLLITILLSFSVTSVYGEGEGVEIISNFTSVFSMEVFLQGFTFTICLSLGMFLIITDQRVYFKDVDSFGSYTTKLKGFVKHYLDKISLRSYFGIPNEASKGVEFIVIVRAVAIAVVFLFLTIISGVIINTTSDKWMRLRNGYHLGLKDVWRNQDLKRTEDQYGIDTYEATKLKSFEKIFHDIGVKEDKKTAPTEKNLSYSSARYFNEVNEFYYQAWHRLISDEKWVEYLMQTHNLVDLTESFSLSFFVLFSLAYVNFLINIFRDYIVKWRESSAAIFLPVAFFVGYSLLSVFLTSSIWITYLFLGLPLVCQFVIAIRYHWVFPPGSHNGINSYYSLTSILIIYGSCICYLLSSLSYIQNNRLLTRKTFGVYRYVNEDLRNMTEHKIYPSLLPDYDAK